MTKRPKFDDAGDSDELQALFDSIAAASPSVAAGGVEPLRGEPGASSAGDSDELQALFDSVAADVGGLRQTEQAVRAAEPAAGGDNDELQALFDAVVAESWQGQGEGTAPPDAPGVPADAVFNQLGQMARRLHDALRELGYDQALQQAADAIPDARERLGYIARMTEQAAARVLNATDVARPIQDALGADAKALGGRWDRLYANDLSVDEFKALAGDTRAFVARVADASRTTNAQLLEIMMAQDFQDLTGQVIKRVVELAQTLEAQLLQVLLEAAPPQIREERQSALMNGPVVSAAGRDDVVTSQAQVDDLLESLGF
ncbi:protein phosphatase CheZ [Thauera sinica]|uniref:Protein phosphatase CheZ n=1 Tax=Thauera sinica TaxID=2665146 RepID=A0ABW1AML5_9RHOO|nr:protein phosphatase CheZ [Thauera sp. K11]ATE60630.1 protein phosphatase CheZ [Thauera sp. K11]